LALIRGTNWLLLVASISVEVYVIQEENETFHQSAGRLSTKQFVKLIQSSAAPSS